MLDSPLSNYFRLTEKQLKILGKFGLNTVRDLLWHFPSRYEGFAGKKAIVNLVPNERASIHARVIKTEAKKTFRKRIKIASATVSDETGSLEITWFNQPYMASILKAGEDYTFTGTIKQNKLGKFSMQNPVFEKGVVEANDMGALIPIYPETRGLTSRWLRFAAKRILDHLEARPL